MIYTIGKTENYERYIKSCREGNTKPEKRRKGTVWENIENVSVYLKETYPNNNETKEYTIYGVIADWLLDTKLPEWSGLKKERETPKYRELTRDAEIIELEYKQKTKTKMKMKEKASLWTRDLPSFNCKGDVIMKGNDKKEETKMPTSERIKKVVELMSSGDFDLKEKDIITLESKDIIEIPVIIINSNDKVGKGEIDRLQELLINNDPKILVFPAKANISKIILTSDKARTI